MKVLLATWAWRPVAGDWTYIENLKKLYEENGFEVIPFSTKHHDNVYSEHEEFFVKAYDYKELNKKKNIITGFKALKNSIVSFEALKMLDLLLEKHKIGFAHLHVIHHWLTPAIIWTLKKHKIPIIWSLHEYKLICPEGSFVSNGKVCERCYVHKFYKCSTNKCKKGSVAASLLASANAYFYHLSGLYKKVDYYFCPSQFLLDKYRQFGFNEKKLVLSHLCYDIPFIDAEATAIKQALSPGTSSREKYILFVGRIEKVKGILTLLKAVAGTDMILKIAGTGSDIGEMQDYVQLNDLYNIQFLGFQSKRSVFELTLDATFIVCPSEGYEIYPFSIIESFLLSKAVIGSHIGGIPELVINGETGLLFEPGNILDLRQKMLVLWNDPELTKRLGHQARKYVADKVNFKTHWNIIADVIDKILNKISVANHNGK